MYLGGSWGNAIYFWNDEKTRIYGFKDPYRNSFAEGSVMFDLANNQHNDTIPLYYISNIKYEDDPKDMFFADISLIGNVENPKNDYPNDWFKGHLNDLYEKYKKEHDETSVLKFKERKRLKVFMDTLKEMEM